jgi:hypothetical protein
MGVYDLLKPTNWTTSGLYILLLFCDYFLWPFLPIYLYLPTALPLSSSVNKETGYRYRRPKFDHQQKRHFLFVSASKGLAYRAPTNMRSGVLSPTVLLHLGYRITGS